MTTFQQWQALRSRAGMRSSQLFCRANTRHSWALWAFLIKGCSGINRDQVHCLRGHNLKLILSIFLSSLPCSRNKITFLWGLVYPFCLLKVVLLPFEPKGSGHWCAPSIRYLKDCLSSFPLLCILFRFWTDQISESLSYLSRAHRWTYFPLSLGKTRAPSTAMIMAIDKGFEDHEQIWLFL